MDKHPDPTSKETEREPGRALVSNPVDELIGKYSCYSLGPRFQGMPPICTLMVTGIVAQTQLGRCGAR